MRYSLNTIKIFLLKYNLRVLDKLKIILLLFINKFYKFNNGFFIVVKIRDVLVPIYFDARRCRQFEEYFILKKHELFSLAEGVKTVLEVGDINNYSAYHTLTNLKAEVLIITTNNRDDINNSIITKVKGYSENSIIEKVLEKSSLDKIDLLKVNIEGEEYDFFEKHINVIMLFNYIYVEIYGEYQKRRALKEKLANAGLIVVSSCYEDHPLSEICLLKNQSMLEK